MAFPLIPIIMGAGVGFKAYGSYRNAQYIYNRQRETDRYWQAYTRRTGVVPRYPYRAGMYYDDSRIYSDVGSILMSAGAVSYFKKFPEYRYSKRWRI